MFERARAAGLPMLGGVDFYVTSAGRQLRAHYWAAQQPALDPDDQQGPSTEASFALGLRPNFTLRLVIIPQAMRVIIPPLTSQYLNITKNSSLAVAIAYPELVSVFAGTALNQVGKEIEMIFMMMMVYLTFSLLTAAFMNWYNSKVKLIER